MTWPARPKTACDLRNSSGWPVKSKPTKTRVFLTNNNDQRQGGRNGENVHEQISFDEGLRRLANTPPKYETVGKKKGGTVTRRPKGETKTN